MFPISGVSFSHKVFSVTRCCRQSQGVVYQATVTREDNQEQQTYIGITEGTFKTRFDSITTPALLGSQRIETVPHLANTFGR